MDPEAAAPPGCEEELLLPTVTQSDRFPHSTFRGLDPPGIARVDYGIATARMWTLHMRVDQRVAVEAVLKRLRARGAECLTGDSCGGDSWEAWAEVHTTGPRALHVYFLARDETTATRAARLLCIHAGLPLDIGDAALSTAGDWAEQCDLYSSTPE